MISALTRQTRAETKRPIRALRACVIGTGRIAEEHLAFLAASHTAQLVGVCDLDPVLARRAAGDDSHVEVATDYKQLLRDVRPDAVHVVTPVRSHAAIASDAARLGASLIIVEKPVATDLAEARDMVHAASTSGARLTEDHNYRFNPPMKALMEVVALGRLGMIREVEVRMAMPLATSRYDDAYELQRTQGWPGGALREFLPHLAYLGLLFAPRAHATSVSWDKRDASTVVDPDDLRATLESAAGEPRVNLVFTSGVAPATTSILIRGTDGWAEADLQNPSIRTSHARPVGNALSPLVDQAVGGANLIAAAATGLWDKLQGSPIYSGIPRFLDATYAAHQAGEELPVRHSDVLRTAELVDELVRPLS